MKISDIPGILVNCAVTSSVIMFIIGTANIALWFLATQQVPEKVSMFFLTLSNDPFVLIGIVNIILLITGCFMETGAAIILFAPMLAPYFDKCGISAPFTWASSLSSIW